MDAKHGGAGRTRRGGGGWRVETLEGRALLSTLSPIAGLPGTVTVGPMAVDSKANLWFAEVGNAGGPTLGEVSAAGKLTEHPLGSSDAGYTITSVQTDASGDVWYVLSGTPPGQPTGKVGVINPSGVTDEFAVADGKRPGAAAVVGGALWVAEWGGDGQSIVQYLPDGNRNEFMVPGAAGPPTWLTAGPDGDVWFVDGSKIGKMTTAGAVTEYPVAGTDGTPADLSNAQLVAGPDGNLWFLTPGELDRITPAGVVSGLTTPTGNLTSLSAGADGNLWIAFLPTNGSPLASTPGEAVARLSTSGQTTVLSDRLGTGQSVSQMAAGSDASLWLNEGGGRIGRIDLAGIPTVTPPLVTPVNIGELSTDAGKTVSGVIAVFTPGDPNDTVSDFTATIDWNDGTVTAANLKADSQGDIDVIGSHTYATAAAGSVQQANITVSGPDGSAATIFAVTQVADLAGNVPYPSLIGPQAAASAGTTTPTTTGTTTPSTGTAASSTGLGTAVPAGTTAATASGKKGQAPSAAAAARAARRAALAEARLEAREARQALRASRRHKA